MAKRNKRLIKILTIMHIFRFKGFDNLHCDMDGNFFVNDKPVKKVYNNGSLAILVGKSKLGIIKLRKLAYKHEKEDCIAPF